jgi:putative SbcD/Mre11-related phosphoesterase
MHILSPPAYSNRALGELVKAMQELELWDGLLITNERCAIMKRRKVAIISDLHIGLESVLEASGLHLPHIQTDSMKASLLRIIERYQPNQFIILGDLKHEFSKNLTQEWSEVQRLLGILQERGKVIVIKGNHDNYLATIASKMGIDLVEQYELDGVTFSHGHLPNDSRPLVIGHEHPSIRLFDPIGAFVKMPCYIHLPIEKILIIPAFSPLASGTDFTGANSRSVLSPVLRSSNLARAKAYGICEIGLLNLGELGGLERNQGGC